MRVFITITGRSTAIDGTALATPPFLVASLGRRSRQCRTILETMRLGAMTLGTMTLGTMTLGAAVTMRAAARRKALARELALKRFACQFFPTKLLFVVQHVANLIPGRLP